MNRLPSGFTPLDDLERGAQGLVRHDLHTRGYVAAIIGPERASLPLQPPRIVVEYAARSVEEAGRGARTHYEAELQRLKGNLPHFMAFARASRNGCFF